MAASNQQLNQLRPNQLRLSALLFGMLILSLFLGFVVNLPTSRIIEARFAELPEDDVALEKWMQTALHRSDVDFRRDGWALRIRFQQNINWANAPQPPWQDLGYRGLHSYRYEGGVRPTAVAFIAVLWLVTAGWTITGLWVLRRKMAWFAQPLPKGD